MFIYYEIYACCYKINSSLFNGMSLFLYMIACSCLHLCKSISVIYHPLEYKYHKAIPYNYLKYTQNDYILYILKYCQNIKYTFSLRLFFYLSQSSVSIYVIFCKWFLIGIRKFTFCICASRAYLITVLCTEFITRHCKLYKLGFSKTDILLVMLYFDTYL